MNVYEKLSDIRVALQVANIKKTGKVNHFTYYELSDFIPTVNKLAKDAKVLFLFSLKKDIAELKVVNTEEVSDFVVFDSIVAMAEIKNCNDAQNLGATHSYIKRYLYLNALELAENDLVNPLGTNSTADFAKNVLIELTELMGKKDNTGKDVFTEAEKTTFRTMAARKQTEQALIDAKLLLEQKELAK